MLDDLFLLDMSIFNELVNKKNHVKKATPFFVFMEKVQLPHDQVLVLKDRNVHCKVLSRLYRNSKFNILAIIYLNFNLVLFFNFIKTLGCVEASIMDIFEPF